MTAGRVRSRRKRLRCVFFCNCLSINLVPSPLLIYITNKTTTPAFNLPDDELKKNVEEEITVEKPSKEVSKFCIRYMI